MQSRVLCLLFATFILCLPLCEGQAPPSLSSLGFEEQAVEPSLDLPVISNFHGSVAITSDLLSMAALVVPPLSMGYQLAGPLTVKLENGSSVIASASSVLYSPHTGYRYGPLGSSAARFAFEENLILINASLSSRVTSAHASLFAMLRQYPPSQWTWIYPTPVYPADISFFNYSVIPSPAGHLLLVMDSKSAACGCFFSPLASFSASPPSVSWTFSRGKPRTIELVYGFGTECSTAVSLALSVASPATFELVWTVTENLWEARWQQAFTPNNTHYSGHLPALVASDSPETARAYYVSILTILSLERTNLPVAPRAYITAHGGPYQTPSGPLFIGATTAFVWDESFEAVTLALLDPAWVTTFVRLLVASIDPGTSFGVDLLSGQPTGYFYAATYLTLFQVIDGYVRVTGDTAFLTSNVSVYLSTPSTMPLINYLVNTLALNCQQYPQLAPGLADYGPNPNTFLECVPDYIHVTPSLSAGNIWMFTRAAYWLEVLKMNSLGQVTPAMLLDLASAGATALVSTLYAGDGVWGCRYPNGSLVIVRHVIDFAYLSNLFCDSLPDSLADAMTAFVQRELVVPEWMRALSLSDAAAPVARPDHGSDGAYPAWPAMTVAGLSMATEYRDGNWSAALSFLESISKTMTQGPNGQANQLPGTPGGMNFTLPFKTALGYTRYTALAGGAFAEMILCRFFGIFPTNGTAPSLWLPKQPRGIDATLSNIRQYGTVVSVATQGLHLL